MPQRPLPHMHSNSIKEPLGKLITVAVPPLAGEYLYSVDSTTHPFVKVGSIVTVPLGRRNVSGFVLSCDSGREEIAFNQMLARNVKIKPINPESRPIQGFRAEHLAFFEWIAKYYVEPLSKVLDLAIPSPAIGRLDPILRASPQSSNLKLGPSQRRIIDYLLGFCTGVASSKVRAHCSVSSSSLESLVRKGAIIRGHSSEELSDDEPLLDVDTSWEKLTNEQCTAAEAIAKCVRTETFQSFLLHGVTGSGKTEVYLEAIIEALKNGKSALLIVPEIALTPQLTSRFEARLKQPVAVLHSNLKQRERWSHWTDLLRGKVKVAIGARSAIFAPLKDLGIIVVDEEHDTSFKQAEGIRYNARDLALVRAKLCSCPVVLGSATPSLESFHHARCGKHIYQRISRRFYDSAPLHYQLIDLTKIKPWEMPSKNISLPLLEGLRKTIRQAEQAFILFNRRGFASYLQCDSCAHVLGCPHCSVTLTFHRKPNSLLCHFCGFSVTTPLVCPHCGGTSSGTSEHGEIQPVFTQRGAGTERVYEELSILLPQARMAKLDRDVASSMEDFNEILRRVREREVDILIGTQMIAKGHDLPDVTFVGVVDCDVGLHVPDFRAAERGFQLLTQVSGRAGRREKPGYVVLQTRIPHHSSLQMTMASDYERFAAIELGLRKELRYPPFERLLRILISAEDRSTAQRYSANLASNMGPLAKSFGVSLLGPAPAPVEKIRNYWRYHILCKGRSIATLQNLMHRLKNADTPPKQVRVVFDLDPQDML